MNQAVTAQVQTTASAEKKRVHEDGLDGSMFMVSILLMLGKTTSIDTTSEVSCFGYRYLLSFRPSHVSDTKRPLNDL